MNSIFKPKGIGWDIRWIAPYELSVERLSQS